MQKIHFRSTNLITLHGKHESLKFIVTLCISKCIYSLPNNMLHFVFLFSPEATSFMFILFCVWCLFHSMASHHCWTEETFVNFSLVMDEQDQRKQMEKLRFVEHCYATKTIQVTEEIWEGFTPCQLDFGSCCKITIAAARSKTAERPWHLHILVNDSQPAADIIAFSSTL